MFYSYNQNNSGGSFDKDENLDEYVIIEANSLNEANEKAESIGIYFDGVDKGYDCDCCGDRWYDPYEPTEQPKVYGEVVSTVTSGPVVIHYLDGRIVRGHYR